MALSMHNPKFLRARLFGAYILCAFVAIFKPKEMQQMFIDADEMSVLKQQAARRDRLFSQNLRGKKHVVGITKVDA